ncbi:MAG: hypothetical protein ACI8XO_003776 [Verrucomicrobiales bacterium]|jgi:hypothetical protein
MRPPYASILLALPLAVFPNSLCADIVINEILHDSEPNTACSEFIELYNSGPDEVDLSGWFFSDGVGFTFAGGTMLATDAYLVVAQDPASVAAIYGVSALGPWTGGLRNEGETVALRNNAGDLVDEVGYSDRFPWPVGALGSGRSMELINPSLDNDLGSSWRSSQPPPVLGELTYFSAGSNWSYRKGASEAPADWNTREFIEGVDWLSGQAPIGFGSANQVLQTNLRENGMVVDYTSVYARHSFTVVSGEIPQILRLRHNADDGFIAFINGTEVARIRVDGAGSHDDTASDNQSPEGAWAELEFAAGSVVEGENVLGILHFNEKLGSSDLAFDFELIRPEIDTPEAVPTPGKGNSDFAQNAAPNIRQVNHDPKQPTTSESTVITAKVTDVDGVGSVFLQYQVVRPGAYIPALKAKAHAALLADPNGPREPNPDYHDPANWTSVPMVDDGTGGDAVAGDDIYTTTLDVFSSAPLEQEKNRTLVRYRITVEDISGASARVPYEDDPALNFAYYIYDGVPDYIAETRSVTGQVPYTHPKEVMAALPVYAMLTTQADFDQCVAYSGTTIPSGNADARSAFNWGATFVYDGVVYDNIAYRLRQRNGRYAGSGKRSFRFRFNDGQHVQLHDNDGNAYPTKWRSLNSHKGTSSRGGVLNFGLYEAANAKLWNLTGSPAPYAHWFHFRVVKAENEQPAGTNGQHLGDFYGMLLAMEDYDVRFLDSHDLGRGNLYKLKTGGTDGLSVQRYQAKDAVDDGSDFRNIINQLRSSKDDEWLRKHVNWDVYYKYKVIVDAVRTYDVSNGITPNNGEHLKNRAYFFEPDPDPENEFGKLNLMPWDSDTSWGPNWNGGWDWAKSAMSDREEFNKDYKNIVREFRDLVWQEDQINPMLDTFHGRLEAFHVADRDKWTNATGTPNPGSQSDPEMSIRIADMKKYAFVGGNWDGGGSTMRDFVYTAEGNLVADGNISRDGGITGGAEVDKGRDAYLDLLAYDPRVPVKPTISYEGEPAYPIDGLAFRASAFDDPQGVASFSAMEWRVAEITPLGGATVNLFDSGQTWKYLDNGIDQGGSWRELNFDDGSWGEGGAPFGWGGINSPEGLVVFATDLSRGVTQYFRRTVEVPDPDQFETFTIDLQVDDGVLVFVNGVEVVRDGFQDLDGGDVTHTTLSTPAVAGDNEGRFDRFEVPSERFVAGTNIIAVELHQASAGSSDGVFDMALEAVERTIPVGASLLFEWDTDWESGELGVAGVPPLGDELAVAIPTIATREGRVYRARVRYKDDTERWSNWSDPVQFTPSLPDIQPLLDNLVISEFMYHPADPSQAEAAAGFIDQDDFEFIEVQNVSTTETLVLTDVRFTKGIDFDFPAGSTIGPGAYRLVVRNQAAFEMRYGAGLPVVGEYQTNDEAKLSNSGERLKLSYGGGVAVRDFDYDDIAPWPVAADGSGLSLVLVDPSSVPDHTQAANWTASILPGGSPGSGDPPGVSLSDWLATFGIVDPNPDPAFDRDGDGLSQFLEFALAGHPAQSLPDERPMAGVVAVDGDDYLTITFRRLAAADGVTYLVEFSGDLVSWVADGVLLSSDLGPGNSVIEVWRSSSPITVGVKKYARVSVMQ